MDAVLRAMRQKRIGKIVSLSQKNAKRNVGG